MDDLSREELEQLFAVFRDQSLQILDEMFEDLLGLESLDESGETVSRLRRAAHTIKGDSACIGLDGVTEVAHRIEDAIDAIASEHSGFNKQAVDLILHALDEVRAAIGGESVEDIPAEVLDSLVGRFGELSTAGERADTESASAEGNQPEGQEGRDESEPARARSKQRREYIRVEAQKVDSLLNLAGEMVITQSVLDQVGVELAHVLPRSELSDRFSDVSAQIGKLVAELQKSVLKMRMVTIDQVFKRFTRPMRELAEERGKKIELEIKGGETELDRALVDLLYEPLLHLLRNAVDHGIEAATERRERGKPESGKITLAAYHEGNQIVVEVSDDGRGIDCERLKARAVDLGEITQARAQEMDDASAMELIFLQGFSTASEVTRVSGRGIGTVAVKTSIEQLRGTVAVKSEAGLGTSFTLRMPLTLAIIRALLFKASGQLLALPLLAVSEIVRTKSEEISRLDGFETYRLRDRFISLVRPGLVLGFERRAGGPGKALRAEAKESFVIVLSGGGKTYAMLADELLGDRELVIKPLEGSWVQNEALAGASVLGDGRVILILDAETVFRKAVKFERSKGYGREIYAG